MTLRFEHPEWFALMALCVPMAWVLLRWCTSMSLVRRWSAVVLRVLLLALIAGAMAGASSVRHTDKVAVVALVDVSGSVQRFYDGRDAEGRLVSLTDSVRAFLAEATRERSPEDLLGVVLFDGAAVAVATPSRGAVSDAPFDVAYAEGTDIAQAIRLGAAMIPPDAAGRLLLISDGNQTTGDALAAAREAVGGRSGTRKTKDADGSVADVAEARLPIDVAPLSYLVTNEVVVESVDAPPQAPAGAVVNVRVVLESASEATGTLQLTRERDVLDINGDEPGSGRRLQLKPGRHVEIIPVPLVVGGGRIHRFDAVWEPDLAATPRPGETGLAPAGDTVASNNRAPAFTLTPGAGSVLVIDGMSDGRADGVGQTLPNVLRSAGIEVLVVPPQGVPEDLISLQEHDLIVLQNVPADAFDRQTHAGIAAYVTQMGGGLLMLGGKQSFGAGAWKSTEIEPLLPVRLDLPEKMIVPAAAVVIILDNSGSMRHRVMGSMRTQQQVANEGAALAIRTMDKTDLVGVISFNMTSTVEVPIAPNANPDRSAAIVKRIASDGGTNLPPALAEAHRMLAPVTADVKHVIVLSDGVSTDHERLPDIAGKLQEEGIKVSTIAIGDRSDHATMNEMAYRGGGQFYPVTDPNTLPRIFVKAVRVLRSPMVREGPFDPVVLGTGSPMTQGLPGLPPTLFGFNLTQARLDPTVTNAMASPTGEPLLAHWGAGLGRVTAFTSDTAVWAREWLNWDGGYSQFWTQVVRNTARPAVDRFQELTTEITGDQLRIRLDATADNGAPLDLLNVPGSVYLPGGGGGGGQRVPVHLTQTGPGVYETSIPAPNSGNYVITLTPRSGTRALAPVVGGASRATGVEYRRLQSNVRLLQQIASETGGRTFDLRSGAGAKLFDRMNIVPSEARSPLWRPILFWALLVMLLDVGTRRVAWDRWFSREFGRSIRRETAEVVRDRGVQSSVLTERLRGHVASLDELKETVKAAVPAPATLTTDDARRIVREQAERRKRDREEAIRARAVAAPPTSPVKSEPPPAAKPTPPVKAEPEAPSEGGLFAAKARARKKMEEGGK